ncbi:MAG TPA: hypothetical protein VMU63_08320, partial [Acidimicrobiales bacterium]|nr:hypothetical protein [Acidimicrobiales bacterium]
PYALNHDPAPSLAGAYSDNLITAFRALYAYHNWLYEHPDASVVGRYAVAGSPAYVGELANIDYLIAHQAHFPTDPRGYDGDLQFLKITLAPRAVVGSSGTQERIGGHLLFHSGLLTVVSLNLKAYLYGSNGAVLQPGQSAGYSASSYALAEGADGQWRIYSAVALHPAGGPQSLESR